MGRNFEEGTISFSHCSFRAADQTVAPNIVRRSEEANSVGPRLVSSSFRFVSTFDDVYLMLWGGPDVVYKDITVHAAGPSVAVPDVCQFGCPAYLTTAMPMRRPTHTARNQTALRNFALASVTRFALTYSS
jgi:hypothetical protein